MAHSPLPPRCLQPALKVLRSTVAARVRTTRLTYILFATATYEEKQFVYVLRVFLRYKRRVEMESFCWIASERGSCISVDWLIFISMAREDEYYCTRRMNVAGSVVSILKRYDIIVTMQRNSYYCVRELSAQFLRCCNVRIWSCLRANNDTHLKILNFVTVSNGIEKLNAPTRGVKLRETYSCSNFSFIDISNSGIR